MEKNIKVTVASKPVKISTEFIKLEALLKFCGAVKSGGEAKAEIQGSKVTVDGEICTERGKKIRNGQIVSYNRETFKVIGE